MDLSLVVGALRRHLVVVVVGALVAVAAGVASGYRPGDGGLEPRTPATYRATATVILENPEQSIYASRGSSQVVDEDGTVLATDNNLAQLSILYAWVVSGDEVRRLTEERLGGPLEPGESLTAQRRTTQPTGDERFGGNASLPIFDVVTTSSTEGRAQELAQAATDAFLGYVATQQSAADLPETDRVDVEVLREPTETLAEAGTSPLPSALITVVLLMLLLLVVVYRDNVTRSRRHRAAPPAAGPAGDDRPRPPAGSGPAADDDPWGDVGDVPVQEDAAVGGRR